MIQRKHVGASIIEVHISLKFLHFNLICLNFLFEFDFLWSSAYKIDKNIRPSVQEILSVHEYSHSAFRKHIGTSTTCQKRREKDPLEGTLRTMSVHVHQYENFMFNTEELVLTCVNVLLDGDENIIPSLSSGKRNKIHSICELSIRLWVRWKKSHSSFCKWVPIEIVGPTGNWDHARIHGRVPGLCFLVFLLYDENKVNIMNYD